MNNAFLAQFVKMRHELAVKAPPPPPAKGVSSISKLPPPDNEGGMSLRGIIEEKPPAKEVLEYFRNRVKALDEEDE